MPVTLNTENTFSSGHEISRLLTAAVVNGRFRKLLLSDPARALACGYDGEPFWFAKDERERILSIKAKSLADFASQLTEKRSPKIVRQPVRIRPEQHAFAPVGLD